MSKIIDISSKLTNEKPVIKLADGKEYVVDNSKNTVLKINQVMKNSNNEFEMMDKAVKALLGEKAFSEIEEMNLTMSDYKVLYTGLMAAVSDEDYDTTEQRFQNTQG